MAGPMASQSHAAAATGARVSFAGESAPGRVRAVNQDSFYVGRLPSRAVLAVVADGMGGHKTGEVASQKAVEIVRAELERGRAHPPAALARAVRSANLGVFDYASEHPETTGMGTTLTALLLDDQVGLVGHVGDSRAYLVRDGEIRQLTNDHSWVADRVRQGVLTEGEARQHRWRNVLTNALGASPNVKLDLLHFEVRSGDRLLLCSDGVSSLLQPELLRSLVADLPPAEAAGRLLAEADNRGSPDNVTAVVLAVEEVEPRPKRYRLPAVTAWQPASVELGESTTGIRHVEESYPVQGLGGKLRRHPWYPYRFWLLGCLYLLLLIVVFSLWR